MKTYFKPIQAAGVLFLLFASTLSFAQTAGEVSGNVLDSSNQNPLEYVSAVLLKSADSSTVGFTFSERDGSFKFSGIDPGNYVLQLFYTGYSVYTSPMTLKEGESKDVGSVILNPSSVTLSTAFIQARAIPVAIKGDTLVYNPNAFKTKNNATVEDLLKKLPGVQVDKNGAVIAQGEKVVKVLVNGKEFFGNDPTKATQNLDAGVLEKVEVLDQKSDDTQFTGVDDGSREKVINLVLKKDANKGYFGKIEAGGGTEETYTLKGTINYFKDESQITAIGNLNNLNQNGFDWQEYYQMLNGANGVNFGQRTYWYSENEWLGNNAQGRQNNGVFGTNAHLKVGEKGELEGSYFLMGRNNTLETSTNAENYLPETIIRSSSDYNSESSNGQHKGLLEYKWRPDTLNWLEIGAEADVSNGSVTGFSLTKNLTDDGGFLNSSMSKTNNFTFNANYKGAITWRRRFVNSKNSVVFQVGGEHNNSGDTSQWVSDYSLNEVVYTNMVPYRFADQARGTGDILYGRVGSNLYLDSGQYLSISLDNKMTLGGYRMVRNDVQNDSIYIGQSPDIATDYRVSKAQVRYSINRQKKTGWYYSLGLGAFNIQIDRQLTEAGDQQFAKDYWMPNINMYIGFNKRRNVRFGAWLNTSESFPGTSQVNPITNVQNPINLTQGNLNLDPNVRYNAGGNFNHQNRKKNRYFYASVHTSYAPNPIVRNVTRDSNNVSYTTFSNEKSTSSVNGQLYYSFLVKKLNMEVGASLSGSNFTYYNILNDVTYRNNNSNFSSGLEIDFEFEGLEFGVEYAPTYSIQSAGYVAQAPNYWYHNFSGYAIYSITDRLEVSSEYDVYYFNGQQVGQQQLVPLLNAEISWSLDTLEKWTIGLVGYDILKQNQSINRNFYAGSYSETRQNTITRFFMLTAKYSIRRGKKKEKQRGNHWH